MTTSVKKYTESYVTRMIYLAPRFVIDSIIRKDSIIVFTETGFVLKANKKHLDSTYPKVKQWVDGYLATTPIGDPSAVGALRNIIQH